MTLYSYTQHPYSNKLGNGYSNSPVNSIKHSGTETISSAVA